MSILPNKTKVGIILQSQHVPLWILKIITKVKLSPHVRVNLVITGTAISGQSLGNNWLMNLALKAENLLLNSKYENYLSLIDSLSLFSNIPHSELQLKKNATVSRNIAALIQEHQIDLLINLSDTDLGRQPSKEMPCDIWSLHADISQDIFSNKEVIGIWLEILRKETEKPIIVYRALEKFEHFFAYKNLQDYRRQCISFIPEQLNKLHLLGKEVYFKNLENNYFQNESRPTKNISALPLSAIIIGAYYSKRIKSFINKKKYVEQWSLLYSFDNDILCPSASSFSNLIPPTNTDWADPHIIFKDGIYYVFIEELFYKRAIGHISVLKLAKDGSFDPPVIVIEKPYHLSYPHIFEFEDKYFMIPESAADDTISLYECTDFPYKWNLKQILMRGVYAVDTTLLFYNNKWWLFTNLKEAEDSSLMNLHIYISEDLFSDRWTPHYLNPVVSNIGSSRGAGKFIFLDGKIYRPSQNSKKRYGHCVVLNQIVVLNEKEYKEKEIGNIKPEEQSPMLAIHTLNSEHELTIMDARVKRKR